MRWLGAVLILVTWLGSLVFGWTHHLWWLVVPPIVFVGYTALLTGTVATEMTRHGIGASKTAKRIASPSLVFALWNTVVASAVFGIAWLALDLRH